MANSFSGIHNSKIICSVAAAGLEALVYEKKSEEKEDGSKDRPNLPKKPRMDLTKNRPAWVLGSVAEAVRHDSRGTAGQGKAERLQRWTGVR